MRKKTSTEKNKSSEIIVTKRELNRLRNTFACILGIGIAISIGSLVIAIIAICTNNIQVVEVNIIKFN